MVEARLIGNEAEGINALDPNKLTPRDLATVMDIAVKLERVARGEPPPWWTSVTPGPW